MFDAENITICNMPKNLDPKYKITFMEFHNDEKILLAAVYLKRKKFLLKYPIKTANF